MTVRVAMWSGPRNISTAMMRAWENRGDCVVSDEPLYAHYLERTGLDHPGAHEVIASGETDWRRVVEALLGPAPGDAPVWYQKHMTHHLLPHIGHGWIAGLRNVLLIRDPREVVASYVKSRAEVTPADIGLPQQVAIFNMVCQHERGIPPRLEARDVLAEPRRMLSLLCERLGVPFSERMLSWPPGRRASDGVWAKHWYASVERSTGFAAPEKRSTALPDRLAAIAEAAEPFYRRLHAHRMT